MTQTSAFYQIIKSLNTSEFNNSFRGSRLKTHCFLDAAFGLGLGDYRLIRRASRIADGAAPPWFSFFATHDDGGYSVFRQVYGWNVTSTGMNGVLIFA